MQVECSWEEWETGKKRKLMSKGNETHGKEIKSLNSVKAGSN
jgi:hypothetical protein